MKRFLLIILTIIMVIGLAGCVVTNSAASVEARNNICRFVKIYPNVDVGVASTDDIYVDATTGVIYFRQWGNGGFSPLYNADGSLKIWKGVIPE